VFSLLASFNHESNLREKLKLLDQDEQNAVVQ